MWGSGIAELIKLARRPATWLMIVVAMVLGLTFAYLVPYAGLNGGEAMPGGDRGLEAMLPAQLVGNSISGLPMFLGAIVFVLAVLSVGGEYGWGTWKTVLTQGPSRFSVLTGKIVALLVINLVLVLGMFASGAVASAVIAAAEEQSMNWPGGYEVVTGIGAGFLIAAMWTTMGALLAVSMRGVALPIGLGLVWLLAVQNLLAAIAAPLIDWVADMQLGLPSPNAGSLVASLGSSTATPGVAELVDSGQAALVIAAYILLFASAAALLLRRRDIV